VKDNRRDGGVRGGGKESGDGEVVLAMEAVANGGVRGGGCSQRWWSSRWRRSQMVVLAVEDGGKRRWCSWWKNRSGNRWFSLADVDCFLGFENDCEKKKGSTAHHMSVTGLQQNGISYGLTG